MRKESSWATALLVAGLMAAGCGSGEVDPGSADESPGSAEGGQAEEPPPSDVEEPSDVEVLTFRYGIELEDREGPRLVAADFPFRSGDRFRFVLDPGFAAHAYVFNRSVVARSYSLLFPVGGLDDPRALPTGRAVRAPLGDGWYRMDTEAGLEQVVLVVTTVPFSELRAEGPDLSAAAFEQWLQALERSHGPGLLERSEAGELVELTLERAAGEAAAMVVRIPLRHE